MDSQKELGPREGQIHTSTECSFSDTMARALATVLKELSLHTCFLSLSFLCGEVPSMSVSLFSLPFSCSHWKNKTCVFNLSF